MYVVQVNSLHQRGGEEAANTASLKAATYSSWAFIAALITAIVCIFLFMAGITLLACIGIDWEKR